MNTSEVPPEGKGEPPDRRRRVDVLGMALGLLSIVIVLPAVRGILVIFEPSGTEWDGMRRLLLVLPFVALGALAAALGLRSASKTDSSPAFWLSAAGMTLAVLFFLASFCTAR